MIQFLKRLWRDESGLGIVSSIFIGIGEAIGGAFLGAEAAFFGGAEAAFGGAFGAEAAFGGFGAEAAFGGGFGLGAEAAGALGAEGLFLGGGLELAGIGAETAFGFEGALAGAELSSLGGELGAIVPGAATGDLAASGAFVAPGELGGLSESAISALNEPIGAGLGGMESTHLGSITEGFAGTSSGLESAGGALEGGVEGGLSGGEGFGENLGGLEEAAIQDVGDLGASEPSAGAPEQGLEAAEPSPEEYGAQQQESTATTETEPTRSTVGNQSDKLQLKGAEQQAAQEQQQVARSGGRAARAGTGGQAGSGGGGFNPMQMLQMAKGLMQGGGAGKSPYTAQGAGYANTLGQTGTDLIGRYNTGQLTAAQLAQVQTALSRELAQTNQFYAKNGQTNSTSAISARGNARLKAVANMQKFLDEALKTGVAATGAAANSLIQAGLGEQRNDIAAQQAMNQAMGQLSRMFTGGGGGSGLGGGSGAGSGAGGGGGGGDFSGGDYDYTPDQSIF